jgi:hypothetical protein
MKCAAARLDAEEHTRKTLTNEEAKDFMNKAKVLMEGPATAKELCDALNEDTVDALLQVIEEDGERNGPAFYSKLLVYFVPEFRDFKYMVEQLNTAKLSMEKAWTQRIFHLFMGTDGSLVRATLKEALDKRQSDLKKQADQQENQNQLQQQVNQQLNQHLNNPEVINALIQNPLVQQAVIAALQAQQQVPPAQPP